LAASYVAGLTLFLMKII